MKHPRYNTMLRWLRKRYYSGKSQVIYVDYLGYIDPKTWKPTRDGMRSVRGCLNEGY